MSRGVRSSIPALGAMLMLLAALVPATASAQPTSAQWTLAPLGPFGDERVENAMRILIDANAAAATAGITLDYADGAEIDPSQDAESLLEASGIVVGRSGAAGVVIERPCRAWSSEPALEPVALALGAQLSEAWAAYDIDFPPCGLTTDPTLADILVFTTPPEGVDLQTPRSAGSFIGFSVQPDTSGGRPSEGTTGGPAPSQGGSLGEETDTSPLEIALGILVAVAVVTGGRLVSARASR